MYLRARPRWRGDARAGRPERSYDGQTARLGDAQAATGLALGSGMAPSFAARPRGSGDTDEGSWWSCGR